MSAASAVDAMAARHVPGSGPVTVDPLGSGLVNQSFRVRRDGRSFSMRLAAPRASHLEIDRAWECRVLRSAARGGLAPTVECCEPSSGLLISRWVQGSVWAADRAGADEVLREIAALVRRVHALPLPDDPRSASPAQWIARYRRRLERFPAGEWASDLHREAQLDLDALSEPAPDRLVLCHGDLHVENIIVDSAGSPTLLDWEYAHVTERLWDLASWASNGDLDAQARGSLLRQYLGREPEATESARLDRLARLYDYVCVLWSELYVASSPQPKAGVARRAVRLAQRLRREGGGCSAQVPAH